MSTAAVSRLLVLVALVAPPFASPARGDDWPQWLGPHRDGSWHEAGVVQTIPETGLPELWRVPVQGGYSGPAVVGNRVYLTDYERTDGELTNDPNGRTELSGRERVLCFDATNGTLLWKVEYDCPYSLSYASGPRCTPTVDGGRVYTLGAEGDLLCLDAETGARLWQRNFKADYAAPTPIWGFCGHPLVDGDQLICLVGGEGSVVVSFNKVTGEELWRQGSASDAGYCPPTIIESAGVRQLLIWDADKLNSLVPETGEPLWSQPLKPGYGMSIMAPRVADTPDGQVLFASGIGRVGALFRLSADKPGATVLWRGEPKNAVYCANSTPYIEGTTLYGCDCETGFLTAVDLKNGDRLWETLEPTMGTERRGRHGTAFLVRHGDRTWLMSETGDLIVARLSPTGYEELSRMHVLAPTNECFGREVVWSHPAFANRCIYARNDQELVCVSAAE
jgi:outer membrane protein assembly factor BamB